MNKNQALIVVDVQNDFLETGSLPVPEGSKVIPVINKAMPLFQTVVLTQDWHPAEHKSFASNHENKKPYDVTTMPYGQQVLWPAHCVQNSKGAELAETLAVKGTEFKVRKGTNSEVDSYSAFFEADGKSKTILADWLRDRGITEVFLCGLATDFCVSWSALDAVKEGFKTFVLEDACRGIDVGGSLAAAKQQWKDKGIETISSNSLR
ncbi:bifunctional nicotinamidase/pyrazinamidase [Turicimonas muris]|uniref:Nicotinamidase n=2 Tax=Turicimonas muris TaxID=1796652 RepID=A0A227KIV6_9BURK|nr:bifunctional nicotinamidase/pyrazinamidase [Turicimonas muris]ANU67121.1 nicotinamidase [Burkholderiales bacterium YL45]OXE47747.1 nicotinamidase [Turicimonas muris]QQQ95976.1 bifunctional nicotinamidase/pyrazinamidase [Turicimonas muris]